MADINFTYLPGDGIGPEVGAASLDVLEAVAAKFGHDLNAEHHLVGGAAIDAGPNPSPMKALRAASGRVRFCSARLAGQNGTISKAKTARNSARFCRFASGSIFTPISALARLTLR